MPALIPFLLRLAVGLVFLTISYILAPKPKASVQETRELDNPKASAGAPIPVVFGTVTLSSPNILWYGEKTTLKRKA